MVVCDVVLCPHGSLFSVVVCDVVLCPHGSLLYWGLN